MSNLSSIHFKKSTRFQVYHNDKIRPSYVIDSIDKVECNKSSEEARILCDNMIEKAKEKYRQTSKARNKNFQSTNYLQSAVVNIKESTTMDDLEKLANKLNEVYKFQCYQISIHRDEGHINENGEKIINHHAHLEFVTLDKENGKSCFRLNKADLRKIQDITAQELRMERGKDKRETGAKRIEPRAYAQMKEQEKAEKSALKKEINDLKAENKALKQDLASQKAVNTAFEEIRQLMIADRISTADEYKELAKYKKQALAQQKQGLTQAELNDQIAQIKQLYNEKLKSKEKQWLRKFVYSTFEDTRKSMIEENKNARLLCSDDDEESMILYDKDDYKALREEKAKIETMIENCENPENIEIQTDIMLLAMKKIEEVREKARARATDKGRIQKQDMEYYKNLADIPAPIGEITPNNEPKIENKADDVKDRIIDLENENKDLKADNDTLTLENQTMKSELSYIKQFLENNKLVDMVKNFFSSIGKKLSMEFEEPNQAPQSAEQKQDIQLTPKADIQRNTRNQNKGRGGI